MSTSSNSPDEKQTVIPRDAAYWATQTKTFKVSNAPNGALNLNVEGRQALSPLQGFGQMWQKTYRIRLEGANVQPSEVIKTWKENFPRFWPKGNRFNAPLTGIAPGEVALLNLSMPVGMRLSTGVMVLYADDESFTLMTPQGHMFAGWITFSSYEDDGCTIAQSQVLIRANDPMYEIGFRLGGYAKEDRFWQDTLKSLAEYFSVKAPVQTKRVCVDPKLQWSQAKNIWHNSAIRTTLYTVSTPIRWVGQSFRRKPETNN
jgi:hypothetical protein